MPEIGLRDFVTDQDRMGEPPSDAELARSYTDITGRSVTEGDVRTARAEEQRAQEAIELEGAAEVRGVGERLDPDLLSPIDLADTAVPRFTRQQLEGMGDDAVQSIADRTGASQTTRSRDRNRLIDAILETQEGIPDTEGFGVEEGTGTREHRPTPRSQGVGPGGSQHDSGIPVGQETTQQDQPKLLPERAESRTDVPLADEGGALVQRPGEVEEQGDIPLTEGTGQGTQQRGLGQGIGAGGVEARQPQQFEPGVEVGPTPDEGPSPTQPQRSAPLSGTDTTVSLIGGRRRRAERRQQQQTMVPRRERRRTTLDPLPQLQEQKQEQAEVEASQPEPPASDLNPKTDDPFRADRTRDRARQLTEAVARGQDAGVDVSQELAELQTLANDPEVGTEARTAVAETARGMDREDGITLAESTESNKPLKAGPTENRLAGFIAEKTQRINQAGHEGQMWLRRLAGRFANTLEAMGPTGQLLGQQVRNVNLRVVKRSNNNRLDAQKVLKGFKKKQRRKIAKAINNRIPMSDLTAKEEAAASDLRAILDRDMLAARGIGLKRRLADGSVIEIGGKGEAVPEIPNAKGRKFFRKLASRGKSDPEVMAVAERMVQKGQAKTLDDALNKLHMLREDQMRGTNSYLERTRVKLPEDMVEWDVNRTLPTHFERAAKTLEMSREWGPDLQNLGPTYERMKAEGADPGMVVAAEAYLKHEAGLTGQVTRADQKIAGAISNYETITKLGWSPISALLNSFQRFTGTVDYPIGTQLKALKDQPPVIWRWFKGARAVREGLERAGAIQSQTPLTTIEADSLNTGQLTGEALRAFIAIERGNQAMSALIASYGVQNDLKKLAAVEGHNGRTRKLLDVLLMDRVGRGTRSIRRRLHRRGMTNDQIKDILQSGRKLTLDEIDMIMQRFVEDTQFAMDLATQPIWWRTSPWGRVLFKFKTFPVNQTKLIWNHIGQEAVRYGNFAPLGRFLIWAILAGEIYNLAKDALLGREESLSMRLSSGRTDVTDVQEIAWHAFGLGADAGMVGMLADLTFGIENFIIGPMGSTGQNVLKFASDIARRPSQSPTALRQLIEDEVAIDRQLQGAWNNMDQQFRNENNRTLDYHRWRGRAFDWKRNQEISGAVETTQDALVSMAEGMQSFQRTDRTLSYDYAARSIAAGDSDSAKKYLTRVFSDAEDTKKLGELIQGARLSKSSKSPLGPLSQGEAHKMLRRFSAEQRRDVRRLDREFKLNYERAILEAAGNARRAMRQR